MQIKSDHNAASAALTYTSLRCKFAVFFGSESVGFLVREGRGLLVRNQGPLVAVNYQQSETS